MSPDLDYQACPLCGSLPARDHCRDKVRRYLQCTVCRLIFVPPSQFLSPEEEKKRYDLHRNSPDDPGYCRFLGRLLLSLRSDLTPGSRGLDFGSGPEPVLARMFEQAGYAMTLFDPFYEPAAAAFETRYDFITAAEVVEHLREPGAELERLWACLKPGGRLGIMTRPAVDRETFPAWHYKNDLTHISFFSPATFSWLADQWQARLNFPESDIAIFLKGG